MKNNFLLVFTFSLIIFIGQKGHAQIWKKVQQKVEDKVEKKVDKMLNGEHPGGTDSAVPDESSAAPSLNEVYAFVPGGSIVFADSFKADINGRMPKYWKSSGGGSIVDIAGVSGKWLALAPNTSYRIDSLLHLPGNFTVEFDLITRSEEAKDIGAMSFGFARDNSARAYISDAYNDNAITATQLHFWNKEITNSSSDTEVYNPVKFPLNNFANAKIHIAIAVEGKHMQVYINQSKLLDTDMFKEEVMKYFYLSGPFDYQSNAQVYFGNFVLAR